MAGGNGFGCPSWLWMIIGVVIFIVVSCGVGFGVNFVDSGDGNNFAVEGSVNNSINNDQKVSVSLNTTIDNENEFSQNITDNNVAKQEVQNVIKPVITANDESKVSTNVSLTNFNRFEIIVNDASKLNQEKN